MQEEKDMIGKLRSVNTRIWIDRYFIELDREEKLVFLYLLTNPQSSLAGIYEVHEKTISQQTEISTEKIISILERFRVDKKALYKHGYIIMKNVKKNNNYNENMMINIRNTLNTLPQKIIEDEECQKFLSSIKSISENSFDETRKNKKIKIIKEESVLTIFNFWNSQKIWTHKNMSKDMEVQIKRKLSLYMEEEIQIAIERYATTFKDDNWYFNTKWDLSTFLRRKNGFPDFLNEGIKWVNYKEQLKKKNLPLISNEKLNISFFRLRTLYKPNKNTREEDAKILWKNYSDKEREVIYSSVNFFRESSVYKDKDGQFRRSIFSYLNDSNWKIYVQEKGEKSIVLKKAIDRLKRK